jgi:hypothetical protein
MRLRLIDDNNKLLGEPPVLSTHFPVAAMVKKEALEGAERADAKLKATERQQASVIVVNWRNEYRGYSIVGVVKSLSVTPSAVPDFATSLVEIRGRNPVT